MKRFNEMIGNLCVPSRFRRILISILENSMGFYYIDLWRLIPWGAHISVRLTLLKRFDHWLLQQQQIKCNSNVYIIWKTFRIVIFILWKIVVHSSLLWAENVFSVTKQLNWLKRSPIHLKTCWSTILARIFRLWWNDSLLKDYCIQWMIGIGDASKLEPRTFLIELNPKWNL